MRPAAFLLALFSFSAAGCSGEHLSASWTIFNADNQFFKAAVTLKSRHASDEERNKFYRLACDNFKKAYSIDKSVFTLSRIWSASESCLRLDDREWSERFNHFAEEYAREHPTEAEYGDAVPMLEGG